MPNLMRLILLIVVSWMAAPTTASAQTCSLLQFESDFGPTEIDIVPGATLPTATARFRQNCTTGASGNVNHCLYLNESGATVQSDGTYYLTSAGTNSRLAWRMTGGYNQQSTARVRTVGSTQRSTGQSCGVNGPVGSACNFPYTMTLTYLPRDLQDRVRPGTYTTTYTLQTFYWSGTVDANFCNPVPAGSPSITSTFTVTANVLKDCQFESFSNIDFGTKGSVTAAHLAAGNTAARAYGNVGVRCTYETPYSITLNDGNNASNGVRRMKNGSNFLAYQLFKPGCSDPWTASSAVSAIGNTVNAINNHQVCAQLVTPLTAAPAAGQYSDTVVVTITF